MTSENRNGHGGRREQLVLSSLLDSTLGHFGVVN